MAAMMVLCLCGCRRHSDLVRIWVEDVTISRGSIGIFMMVGGRVCDVRSFLEDYLRRLGLERG